MVRRPRPLAWLVAGLCLAPTPGDLGGCGEPARDLDPTVFFLSKRGIECQRCDECGIRSLACEEACRDAPVPDDFPAGCFPLVHDGTVCLRAITQSSCAAHRRAMSAPPLVPGECNFCPPAGGG